MFYAFKAVAKAAEGCRNPNAIRVGISLFLELRERCAWQWYAKHKSDASKY